MISCPFCGGNDLVTYRFDMRAHITDDGEVKTFEAHWEKGDYFAIECCCGCRLTKPADELSQELQNRMDDNDWDGTARLKALNNSQEYFWKLMEEHWNRRAEL